MASHRRGPWSQSEDAYLVQLVHTQGALNWVRIAQIIGSRSPKQCRERYHQNLKPTLNHEPISPEEGLQIERLVAEMGKRWAEIARRLHGRSDNAVKNWWNGSMNRRRRHVGRRRPNSPHGCDEQEEQSSFSQPPFSRPLLLLGEYDLSNRRDHDAPLPSPSVSEVSRADSVDRAPSLVSDSGSSYAYSPLGASSPSVELPPLSSLSGGIRRPSVSLMHHHSGVYATPEYEASDYNFPRRYSTDVSKHYLSVASIQLPPLQPTTPSTERPSQRDSRMHLSSLLA